MKAGTLRHVVEIQERTTKQDSHGNPRDQWIPVATVRAEVKPINGSEKLVGNKVAAEVTHEIRMRYREFSPSQRLSHKGRVLDINNVLNIDERNREILCMCKEAAA